MSLPHTLLIVATILSAVAGAALWRRRLELRDLERSLYPEVVALRLQAAILADELARRHVGGQALDAAFFAQWRLSAPLVYPAVGGALGRLPGEGVDRVGYFHAQLAEARERTARARVDGGLSGSPYRLLSNLVRACNNVGRWTDRMEARHGRPLAGLPDLAEANRLLGTLEDAGGEPIVHAWCWADTAS